MGKFLTKPSVTEQLNKKGKFKLMSNELYRDDDGTIYLAWRGYETDNFTWIKKADWDIRCSHIHDVGCQYHQLVKVLLPEEKLRSYRILTGLEGQAICKDIPLRFLRVVNVSGHFVNNLFGRMLKSADCPPTPFIIQKLYRAGVSLNFKWFFSGREKIDLKKIYKDDLNDIC